MTRQQRLAVYEYLLEEVLFGPSYPENDAPAPQLPPGVVYSTDPRYQPRTTEN